MRKVLRIAVIAVIVLLLGIQFVPVEKTNPPASAEVPAPPAVRALLERSCFDCHSHQTDWPWYARVAPASWVLARHVEEGREHLNFSAWDMIPAGKLGHVYEEIWEEVEEGKMPLGPYLLLHGGARLSDADRALLRAWTREGIDAAAGR